MEDYVNQVISATNQLRNADFNIPDLWVGMLLLAGLPKDFKPMIMALQSSGVAITGDVIKTKLLQEEKVFYGKKQNSPAFATTKQPGQKQQQPTSSKGPKCRKCQKFGHIAKDCKDNKEQKIGGSTFCTVLSTFDLGDADDWIFDSAAYAHMTANRSMLFRRQEQRDGQ
ncbi:uncharacterized protein LOC119767180 [Culex quinquefasciatus]|uniref:uncharacterized protein LOC119767180 n=1 Tax=Culex quinquefasciatus TaxID=7176 RepID=UPI0018E390C0|nr:uncharacterized protein LOC119767180 [Culex quinquefasciatus]